MLQRAASRARPALLGGLDATSSAIRAAPATTIIRRGLHASPRRCDASAPARFVILGAPGAGKGTISGRLQETAKGKLKSVVVGDLLRQEINEGTPFGKEAKRVISAGGLLPDESLVELLETALRRLKGQSFILDGYPRRATQAAELDRILRESDGSPLSLVISLDVPDEVILQRIQERWIHRPSGRTYNLSFNPPRVAGKDDVTGEALTQREDDNDTFRKRLEAYHAETQPIKSYYSEQDGKRPPDAPSRLFAVSGTTSDYIWPFVRDEVFSGRFPALA